LPKKKLGNYAYNAAVEVKLKNEKKIISMVPNKAKTNEYNEKITKSVIDTLEIQ
jgi:hypothetical protein